MWHLEARRERHLLRDSLTKTRAGELLGWYDAHARTLPWRVPPGSGRRADPYRVWLSEIMLQQTTVAAVIPYFDRFTGRWPTVGALAAAPLEDVLAAWAGLGYYARARNLHACAVAVAARGGVFPDTEAGLRELPGIGPYTAAAIAAIAFDRPATVVDGNVERVMARLHAVGEPLPDAKARLRELAAELTPAERPGDYAQAVMDLGATICTPRSPACGICPWMEGCAARLAGIAAELPRKRARAAKPVREGVAWLALDAAGGVHTVQREGKGLLGGMLAVPTGGWDGASPAAPFAADWEDAGEVRHTFTHFHLRLEVRRAAVPGNRGWMPLAEARDAMPTVFAKVLRLAGQSPRRPPLTGG